MTIWFNHIDGIDQYHEPPSELSEEMRTFALMIISVIEEAEAMSWYEQRIAIEKDAEAKAIMQNAQQEEFKHFVMDLEFLLRKKPIWRQVLQGVLFQPGDIVEKGEKAEDGAKLETTAPRAPGCTRSCEFDAPESVTESGTSPVEPVAGTFRLNW